MAKKTRTILAHAVTRRFTWTACHSPPRGVRTPAALIWSTTGRMLSAAGESWAFKEIGDRLEGKPMQPIEHSDADDRTSIEEFTDAELSAILRSRLKIVTIENDEERPEGESLN
jgi:hypothetical protein